MNIKEISEGSPKWWAVVSLGLALVFVTIALPMSLDWLYRKYQSFVGARPRLSRHPKRLLVFLGLLLLAAIVVIVVVVVLLSARPKD